MLKKLSKIFLAVVILFLIVFAVLQFPDYYKKFVYPLKYQEHVEKYSLENDMDPYFIYAIIKTESNFNPNAESDVGARGLMQLMEDAFDWVKYRMKDDSNVSYNEMYEPERNIQYGTYMMKLLCDEYQDPATAVAAYHAGRSTINKWLNNPEYSSDGKTLENIPSKTTAHYVHKVMKSYKIYVNLYQ